MKNLLLSVSVAALIVPMAAHAAQDSEVKMDQSESTGVLEQDTVTGDKAMDIDQSSHEGTLYLQSTDVSAKHLLGEGIIGTDGDRVARVDDIVIGDDGRAKSVVILSGGVLGLGGSKGELAYNSLGLDIREDNEPRVTTSLSEETVKSIKPYNSDQSDVTLATEMIGSIAALRDSDEQVRINDVILSPEGEVKHVIVSDGMLGALGWENEYAFNYAQFMVEQGSGGYVLNVEPTVYLKSDKFEYDRSGKKPADRTDGTMVHPHDELQ